MFPKGYFTSSYFAPRYFPPIVSVVTEIATKFVEAKDRFVALLGSNHSGDLLIEDIATRGGDRTGSLGGGNQNNISGSYKSSLFGGLKGFIRGNKK